jgi:uncharacterized membrane protein YidH (DUF202 family)
MALEFGGGILEIVGFLVCISNAISTQREETLHKITRLGQPRTSASIPFYLLYLICVFQTAICPFSEIA